jgi:uncharacterized protein involved in type VI secretion and phage assembly
MMAMADAGTVTQDSRLLRIETVRSAAEKSIPGDPLLLIKFDGEEGISIPYQYDIVMYRSADRNKTHPLEAKMLVGTVAKIHIRGEDEKCETLPLKLTREGVFLTFEQLESDQPDDYVKFGARLVPHFKLLDFESVFRVYEQISVLNIIRQVLEMGETVPIDNLDFSMLEHEENASPNAFPLLPYCVQFNESSFNFVSRLMRDYGIWYYFGHRGVDRNPDSNIVHNGMMIFGRSNPVFDIARSETTGNHMRITNDPPGFPVDISALNAGDNVGWTVSSWRRTYTPPSFIELNAGNFNILKPTNPIDASNKIRPSYDRFNEVADETRLLWQSFPTPAMSNDSSAGTAKTKKYEDAKGFINTQIQEAQADAFSISGVSKNPTFIPGAEFTVDADTTKREIVPKSFVLKWVKTSAYDLNYDFLGAGDILSQVWDKSTSQFKTIDSTMSIVGQGLQEYMQNYIEYAGSPAVSGIPVPYFLPFFAGGALGFAVTTALATAGTQLLTVLTAEHSGFSNSFICSDDGRFPPLPKAVKPKAYGPHLAIVIGPNNEDELDTSKTDVFADKIGRVRVRFPWDKKNVQLSPTRPAAWVRVSEGWAGQQFGSQFLPRIGQEVIVNFIDGDPDRPIITGRVYNADHGFSNMPFPSGKVEKDVVELGDVLDPIGYTDFRFTGLKTKSTPRPPAAANNRFHLQRFDDTYNCEQILLRSQGRLDVTAYAHSFETTYGNKNLRTVKGTDKDGKPFGGNMLATIDQEYDLHVGGNRYEQVDKDYELTVKGNVRADLQQNLTAVIKGDVSIALNSLTIEATEKISFKVGQSFVVIDHCAVYINAPSMIYENSGGSADSAASVTMQNVSDAALAEPGDQWNKRLTDCNVHGAPGGGRSTHTENPTPAPNCDSVINGVSCDFLPSDPG